MDPITSIILVFLILICLGGGYRLGPGFGYWGGGGLGFLLLIVLIVLLLRGKI